MRVFTVAESIIANLNELIDGVSASHESVRSGKRRKDVLLVEDAWNATKETLYQASL
jgi:PHD/YefM family antitoxin component YafN of YafNO toxin-antitoxin module